MKRTPHFSAKALLFLLYLGLGGWSAQAEEEVSWQSLESIQTAIREFLESKFRQQGTDHEIRIPPLDPHLRFRACSQGLEVSLAQGSAMAGAVSVKIQCPGDAPWSFYHRVQVDVFEEVALLANSLKAGTMISAEDIEVKRMEISRFHGATLKPAQAIGHTLRRSLAAHTVLLVDYLANIKPVKRGDLVSIRNEVGGIAVSMSGVALMDGEQGQRIRVRNEQSGRVIQATVVGPGNVVVDR
jgi:flagella basal body P-ring formation protein FlgA